MALKVSDIAKQAGVSPDAVRYYEKEGLLPPAPRSPSGYREYDDSTAERIKFIKGAQEMASSWPPSESFFRSRIGARALVGIQRRSSNGASPRSTRR